MLERLRQGGEVRSANTTYTVPDLRISNRALDSHHVLNSATNVCQVSLSVLRSPWRPRSIR